MQTGTTLNIRTAVLSLAFLLFAVPVLARDKTDIVVMKNGDRLTGEVKGLDAGVLYVNMSYILGTSSLDWSKVARLESKQLFIIRTEDGTVYKGALNTAEGGRPVKIEVVETPEREVATINRSKIVEMAETSDRFWQRFNGELNFGTTYSKGNETVQYTLSSEVEYLRERWSASANLSSTLSSSTGTSASTRNDLALAASHLLPWKNYFYAGLGDFLQSSVQGIQLQTSVGAGIGRYLKNTNRTKISLLGGFAWQNTNYQQAKVMAGTQNLAAALIAADVKLFRFNKTNLDLGAIVFPVLSDPGRVKFSTNAAYYIKITSNLSWNISFYGNWDNQPPPHFSGSDYGTSSGVSWTFGMK
jgi:Protein of unknown function, DUF481